MRTLDPNNSALLVIDLQAKLMPAIEGGAAVVSNARRLIEAAALLEIPTLFTEQNPRGLGPTVAELAPTRAVEKMHFDVCRAPGWARHLPDRPDLVVAGCEAHVCVLQTVLGLLDGGRRVFPVQDAIGSRRAESKEAAIRRMEKHGAEVITTEMAIFEWLGTAEHPRFREAMALVR